MFKFKKIYVEITNNCNLNCSYCKQSKRKRRNMTLEEFETILKKIQKFTKTIYLHVEGEPLLHKNIIEMLKLCEQYEIRVNITTNGTFIKQIADKLNACKALKKINFSLHSENNKPQYLEEIFSSVEKLNKDITIIYRLWTLQDNTFDEKSTKIVEKIIDYYKLNAEIVEKIYKENNISISSTIYVDKDNEFKWPEINEEYHHGFCHALKTQIAILVDGTIVPCCLDSDGIIDLGNIFIDNLDTIIKSKRYLLLKKSFQDRKPSEKLCQSCTFKR